MIAARPSRAGGGFAGGSAPTAGQAGAGSALEAVPGGCGSIRARLSSIAASTLITDTPVA
ncbi:MAG: hypothetical protein HY264_11600 [Chloroflexi bacterium]|nr:hypothetical protein [Chloroflexota bacterium]